jgi:hypothetical protein
MNFTADKLKQARDAGYSDDEIWGFASEQDDRFTQAKDAGYSLDEVSRFFSNGVDQKEQEKPSTPSLISTEAPTPESLGIELPTPPPPPESILRQAADIPVQFAIGVNNSIKGLTDLFGADNPVSQNLNQNVDWYRSLLSASAKEDEAEISRIMEAAENEGIGGQLKAGLEAFAVAPVDFVSSGLGSLATFAIGGAVGRAAGLGVRGIQAVQAGMGAGMGAGIAKSEIYQSVKDEMISQGKTEEMARSIAMEAQSFGGKNLDQILLSAGLGAASAYTGAESIISKVLTKGGISPTASRIGNTLKSGLTEGVPEFAQAAQEAFASNLALQREGVNVPLTQGVFSRGALEGLAGVAIGAGAGAIEPRISPPTTQEVNAAASETKDVARQNMDIAPETASLVERQAETLSVNATVSPRQEGETNQEWRARTERERAETPEQRVARLQEEARAATEIELEEEPEVAVEPPVTVTPPVEPTPEGAVAPVEPAVTPEAAEPQPAAIVPAEPFVTPKEPLPEDRSVTIFNYEERVKPIQDRIDAKIDELVESGMTFEEADNSPEVAAILEERLAMDRGAINSYRNIVNQAFTEQGVTENDLITNPAFSIIENVYAAPRQGDEGLIAQVSERGQEAFDDDAATIKKLSEAIFKYRAEAEGLSPEGLLGPNSNLTDAGKQARVDEARIAAETIHNQIKNSLLAQSQAQPETLALPPAEVAPEVTPTPETPNIEPLRRVAREKQVSEEVEDADVRDEVPALTTFDRLFAFAEDLIAATPEKEESIRKTIANMAARITAMTKNRSDDFRDAVIDKAADRLRRSLERGVKTISGARMVASAFDDVKNLKRFSGEINEIESSMDEDKDEGVKLGDKLDDGQLTPDVVASRTDAATILESFTPLERAALSGFLIRKNLIDRKQAYEYIQEATDEGFTTDDIREAIDESEQKFKDVERGGRRFSGRTGVAGLGQVAPTETRIQQAQRTGVTRGATPSPAPEVRESRREPAPLTQQDREYLDAVERGDLDVAQRLVDEAADRAGYNIGPMWHGTDSGEFTSFKREGFSLFFFSPDKEYAKKYGKRLIKAYLKGDRIGRTNQELTALESTTQGRVELWSKFRGDNAIDVLISNPEIGNREIVVSSPNQIKSGEVITRDDKGNIIPPSQRFQPTEEDIRYAKIQMPRPAGMKPEAVTAKLESLGFGRGGIVSVVNEPDASFEGRTIIRDGKVVGIELNAAALKDDAAVERVLNHEIAESANADGALNRLVAGLTPKERKEINDAITRLGYSERARTAEEAARAVELLAEGWRGRRWFERAVARIEAWANKLGYKLTRRAAEYIAARNVSEINAEFKQAYNKFINVQGEAREARVGEQAVVDADMGRRSQTELTPQEIEQLERGEKIRVYRAMQVIDGKLYPPMSALVGGKLRKPTEIGTWEKAEERPDLLDKRGKFILQKGNKATVPAAYNPYFHTSTSPLNDQFSSAYKRDNLVTVEVEVPASELTSGYKAEGAKDAVGEVRWNAGPVSSKLPADKKRKVILSRYAKVVRIVPDSEVAGIISNLLEGTNLSIPENTVTPSLKAELEKQGITVTPRPARGEEIRESRREDAIPTFSEGSPEASTLSTMASSMAKVDAASEAKPNPENKPTYKISEIASVWMDQGGDARQLQDMVVEYTNLTPANAKRVANAIAKQYDIQQGIAEARVETAEGVSLEGLPEGVSIPKEADPKRPKTVIQRLIDVTTGVRVPPVKITATERSLLNNQIRMRAAANREAKKAQQETANEVVEMIKAMELRGPVRPKQAQALAKRAAKVIWTSEKSMESFTAYAEKVVANTNYDADLREAKAAQKRAAELSKRKTIASPQREILSNVTKIGVNMLDNPREFADVVNYYMRGFKSVVSPDYLVVPDDEMTSYLSQAEDIVEEAKIAFDRVVTQRLSEKYGVSPDRIREILDAQDIERALVQYAKREVAEAIINEKANDVLAGLKAHDQTSLRNDQRKILDSILNLDPSLLSSQEKQQFIRVGNNIIFNNQTHGAELFAVTAKGQQMAKEAASNEELIAKNKAWVNVLPSLRSRTLQKTWRNWALELQSVADTFRNAFGKGAMAKVYRMMGMYDLDRGFTAAANAVNQIQEEIAEFYNKLENKYKAAARNQDGILAEGVVGFLIQKVPEKGEIESLAQRRNLIQQDIRNRRISQDADRIEMANRIERILQQLDGESVSDIMDNLKRDYRANYESVIWLKDTLFPKYKEFLKGFDENFNDQANNYENTDYLPIGFIRAGVSLAITPENEALYYEHVSLRPKQSSYTIKRADYTQLPTDKTTNKPKEIEFNLRRNAFDSLSDQINKAYTSPAWQQIFAFMKTPESEKLFGGAANKEFFIERLNRLRLSRMRRGSMSTGYIEKTADVLSVFARKIGTGIALGGAYQPFKQAPDQIIAAIGTTGRADLMAENMAPSALKAAKALLDKFSIGRRGDASSGYKYINQMEGAQNKIERYLSESRWDAAKEQAGKIADVWLLALKKTDYVFAAGAWMTYYRAQLAKDGVAFQGWEKEAELLETDTARQDAASYAEQMTDIYQGSSDPTKMATFVQSGKSGWENLFKAIFVPFNSFAVQQRMRIYSDARDSFTKSGDTIAGRFGLASTIGGLVAFHSVRRFALPAFTGLGVSMIYAAFGVDMDEPDEEKKAEDFAKRWRQFLGEFTANLLVGGSGQIVEAATIDTFNYAAYLIAMQTENETVLGEDGEIISFSQYAKERSPFWRYRSFDNAMSLGMFDIGLDQGKKAILETKTLMAPEEMENFTTEEQRLLYFAALSDWLYLMRLNDADFARMVDRARREIKSKSKENEREMARILSGR